VGYDKFAVALNTNVGNGIQATFVNPEGVEDVCIIGHPSTLVKLVGLEAA
jgi:hypothetical protein